MTSFFRLQYFIRHVIFDISFVIVLACVTTSVVDVKPKIRNKACSLL